MPASTPPSRPRLVRPDEGSPPSPGAAPAPARWRWLLPLALLAAFVAAAGWGAASRRAAGLEAQVHALSAALEAARAEITARQHHLEALRGAAAEVEARVGALRRLAEQAPTAPVTTPAPAPAAAPVPAAGAASGTE